MQCCCMLQDFSNAGIASMLALRDIKAGEELTLAYVSPFGDLNERLVHLWRSEAVLVHMYRKGLSDHVLRAPRDMFPIQLG